MAALEERNEQGSALDPPRCGARTTSEDRFSILRGARRRVSNHAQGSVHDPPARAERISSHERGSVHDLRDDTRAVRRATLARLLRDLWILSRPKGMVLIALLPLIGFTFAYWDHGCTIPHGGALAPLGLLALLWMLPHAGTMWLNAALDRDEGQVLWGTSARVPRHIERYAYATLVVSSGVALAVHIGLGLCVLGCAILSVLYSHPRTAWKGHPVLGPAVNAVGYGILSPLGGWMLAELPPTPRGLAVLAVSVTFVSAAYLAAQAFQEDEDRARGYRTIVALRGAAFTLALTRAFLLASVALTLALAAIGWFPRTVFLATPAFVAADLQLARWRMQPGGGDETWARAFFKRLTIAGLLCLASVSIHYAWMEAHGGPLGGLGTASGVPRVPACPPSSGR